MRVRIVSPRWDPVADRWQMPGEEIDINPIHWDAEPPYHCHHAIVIPDAPPAAPEAVEATLAPEASPEPFRAPFDKMTRTRRSK